MDSHVNVLLYSKFSEACKNFVEIMEKVPSFRKNTTLLCIDNKEIRDRIKKNEKLQVSQVPCLVRIYDNTGYVELFEGEKAFSILDLFYKEMLKEQVKFNPPSPKSQIFDEEISEPTPDMSKIPQQKQVSFSTPIEELVDNDIPINPENDNAISTYLHIPKGSEEYDNNKNIPERAIKKVEGTSPSTNLVSRAMQMQKERESEIPSNANMPKI